MIIVFPSSGHVALPDLPDTHVLALLCYLCKIIPTELRADGLSFVANLQKTSQAAILKLLTALNSLQVYVIALCQPYIV